MFNTSGASTKEAWADHRPTGARCGCDDECAGEGALCMLGICMKRADGPCPASDGEAGCEAGFRCFNTDILSGTGVCWPAYDATCEGVENRHGLCSPLRGAGCDPACGAACAPDTVARRAVGAPCAAKIDCSLRGATCYSEASDAAPNGWVLGYCLSFGCESDAPCGPEAACFGAADDGSRACMNTCGNDLDCRPGYVCREEPGRAMGYCYAGCDAAATCPSGFRCAGGVCLSDDIACSPERLDGACPKGTWCQRGECTNEKFTCDDAGDPLEPDDTSDVAEAAPSGITEGLAVCRDDEDWFRVEVPEHTLVRVGVRFEQRRGDLDLVAYDGGGHLLGARNGDAYPYAERDQETGTEYHGFYSERGGAEYYVRVVGYDGAQNAYSLHVDSFPYVDGASCTDAGFTADECAGRGEGGSGLLPFPFPEPGSTAARDLYTFESYSNYRFARRELIMIVRDALAKTAVAFPRTTMLSLLDTCQIDGVTPGYDVGEPRHPETTHDQGGSMDIAYFQTDGSNDGEVICGDGSVHADKFCSRAARTRHKVDLAREAFFMAKLFASPRTRAIGVDQVIAPLLIAKAKQLRALPAGDPRKITAAELAGFSDRLGYGSGWPYHHHHIHLSLQWWDHGASSFAAPEAVPPTIGRAAPTVREQQEAWPPRP